MRAVFRIPGTVSILIATTLNLCWVGLGPGFSTLFLTHVRGFSLQDAGSILAISGVIGFAGAIFIPVLADLRGRKPTVIACSSIGGVAFLLFSIGNFGGSGLIGVLTLANFCIGGLSPLVGATIPSELVPLQRGTAIGFNVFVAAMIGTFLMPFIGGVASDNIGLVVPLLMAGVAVLLIGPVVVGVPETAPRILARRGDATSRALMV